MKGTQMRLKIKLQLITAAVLILFAAGCSSSGNKAIGEQFATPELIQLQGSWIPVEAELGGSPFPEEVRKSIKMEISNDVYTVYVAGNPDKGKLKIYGASNPRTMEIVGTEGPNNGKKIPAIFEINGDIVSICYDLSGKAFPAEFKTAKGTQLFLVKYAKVKN
jgi:uncharacterized protein (TIGR03067 family)